MRNQFTKLITNISAAGLVAICSATVANAQTLRNFVLVNDTSETQTISLSKDGGAPSLTKQLVDIKALYTGFNILFSVTT